MLTVIIPTYQERDNLNLLLARIAAVRERLGEPVEVLVVDGASSDGTAACARQILTRERLGRVIALAQKQGLAAAVMRGVQEASGDLIGVMDADLSHPPELLPDLVSAARAGYEVVVGSRYVEGGGIEDWPLRRRLLSRMGNLLAQPLVSVEDATSGFFVCQTHVLKPLAIAPDGFKILLEVLVRGRVQKVREVPYRFKDRTRGASKLDRGILWLYVLQLTRLYRSRLTARRLLTGRRANGCADEAARIVE